MTEEQARAKLRKLLAITLDRGAAAGEQANATRAIGIILQEHTSLRDMIVGREESSKAQDGAPEEPWTAPATTQAFWKGVLLGVGSAAMAVGALVLASLSQRRS